MQTLTLRQRQAGAGLIAGLISGVLLIAALGLPGLLIGGMVGSIYALAFRQAPGGYLDDLFSGVALSVPLWGVFSVVLLPLLAGLPPQWTVEGMLALFPALLSWMLFGASLGILCQVLARLADRAFGPAPQPEASPPAAVTQIVILGGGFAGATTAQQLEQVFGADPSVALTLVSDTNAVLFTPMLAEVAGSSLEPTHITHPLRTMVRRTEIVRGQVERIDVARRRVILAADRGLPVRELPFDHIVLALGAVSNYLGLTNVQSLAFDFKSLIDAIRIRNHVIDMLERADREPDLQRRRALLTFVIAGGGFSGAELAGALNDFVRGSLAYYRHIPRDEVRVILVHSRDRILPELSEPLAAYALERMRARGVTFQLNTRVADARPGMVVLKPAETIETATLIWTAGTTPNPVIQGLPVERNRRGAVVVEATMAVPGLPGVWALGDCAEVPNTQNNQPSPPTAQFALRQAKLLARNIHASVKGQPLKPFAFEALGVLAVIGHHTACAELTVPFSGGRSVRFSGLFAWLLWRGVYLSKLPGLERQVRVLSDWIIELFFPRDIVQTIELAPARSICEPEEPPDPAMGTRQHDGAVPAAASEPQPEPKRG